MKRNIYSMFYNNKFQIYKFGIHTEEAILPRKRLYSTYMNNPFEPEDPFWKKILIMSGLTLGLWCTVYNRKR
jgi:hypothetical protein